MRVEKLYEESKAALDALNANLLITHAIAIGEISRKTLAIAAASAFEYDVTALILSFGDAASGQNRFFNSLIKAKIIERQYHSLFDWKQSTAASFFGSFGQEAREYYNRLVKPNVALSQAVRDFLELGNLRNEIVHQDYTTYTFDKTLEDIIIQYRSARKFVEFLELFLKLAATGRLEADVDRDCDGQ